MTERFENLFPAMTMEELGLALERGSYFELSQWGCSYDCTECGASGGGVLASTLLTGLGHAKFSQHDVTFKITYDAEPYMIQYEAGESLRGPGKRVPIDRDYDPRNKS